MGRERIDAAAEGEEVTVRILHTGSVTIDRALAFRERTWHPAPYTGWFRSRRHRIEVPVSAYLIEHPAGPILVDAGWHASIRANQRGHLGLLPSTMFTGHLPEGDAVHEQLASLGLAPEDLAAVILTHLDADHVSGIEHVADADRIVVSEPEWAARGGFRYVPSMWAGVDIEPIQMDDIAIGPTGEGYDLVKDGSVRLVLTAGHSAGHCSVMVRVDGGDVLLVGDAGYAARAWEGSVPVLPGLTVDDEAARASLGWVHDVANEESCIAAIANHDPDVEAGVVR